jgi:antitoxin PrlF
MQRGPLSAEPIEPDQAYFWTEAWQAGEREADEDMTAGRVYRFEKAEDLIAHLHQEQQARQSET